MRSLFLISFLFLLACEPAKQEKPVFKQVKLAQASALPGPEHLSEWNLFLPPLNKLQPEEGVIPYTLNTPLFTDYAHKLRFFKLPKGEVANYQGEEVLDFPQGSIVIKNFYYPADFRKPEQDCRILETRLLIREKADWKALTYVWNDEQTEAFLQIAGKSIPVSWTDKAGVLRNVNYSVPNLNQCKGCHERNGQMSLIGPTLRQLNREQADGNQLALFEKMGLVKGLPESNKWSRIPDWDNPADGTLDERARGWLEINCAHCHRLEGPAKNSGLYLTYFESDPYKLGVNKPPVAAGRGSGGLRYGIVPGKPEESILFHRIASLDPGVMMPELGRKLAHEEGIELIRNWITQMPTPKQIAP